jgi:hypothetical protein
MIPNAIFALGLLGAIVMAFGAGEGVRRTCYVMAANWAACWAVIIVTGDYGAWMLFAPINAASAWVTLRHPAARTQAVIGAIYLVQMTFDVAFGLGGSTQTVSRYQTMQSMAGWVQIVALAAGGIYGTGLRLRRDWLVGHRAASPDSRGATGMDGAK